LGKPTIPACSAINKEVSLFVLAVAKVKEFNVLFGTSNLILLSSREHLSYDFN
jgi:hypothetical protein